nr:proteasome maturation protein-like [Kogia breviceps]
MNVRGLGSQLKDSIPVTELSASGPFESHDLLQKGFSCVKNELLPSHPLELSGKKFQLDQDKMRGNDETTGFEGILNDPSQSELMGEPHLMVEYKLGLL